MQRADGLKAVVFDVFGTCVDWRGGVAREVALAAARLRVAVDACSFADAWRGRYQPSMEEVRSGRRPWTVLDSLHRESLDALLPKFGLGALDDAARADLNRAWHRLDPWPDAVEGLTRLKRRYVIGTMSNGNVALLVNMARRAGLPWDVILGAETSRAYKPLPAAYLNACAMLGLAPGEVMLAAAHEDDLRAAAAVGLRTGFVARPLEYGGGRRADDGTRGAWDVVAADFLDLAARLGA
jgi:2-haloacid dehalogenase